jgi:hypothetical protein
MAAAAGWAPGWFPDPTLRHDHRWWDGAAWTAHVADAGVASLDELTTIDADAASPGMSAGASRGARPGTPRAPSPATSRSNDPVAVAALSVAIASVLFALVPGFGLILPTVAIVLAVIARSRIRTSQRTGDGLAISGLIVGIGSLLLAAVISVFAAVLLSGSGGELAGAFAEYVACLEVNSVAECRILLEESLARITG